jgi:hypothetical protein
MYDLTAMIMARLTLEAVRRPLSRNYTAKRTNFEIARENTLNGKLK